MQCRYTTRALRDLEDIGEFIAADNPGRASSYLSELTAHCRKTAQSPTIRRIVAHLEGVPLRKALFGRYQIYYALLEDQGTVEGIEIVHIRHGSRLSPVFGADGSIT